MLGIYEDGIVTVFYHGKHMKIRPSKIILATGASEKFLEFPGNDLPGIYGAGAVQTLMNVAGVKPAERVLMVGAGNIGLIVSYQLMQAGVEVAGIIEAAPKIGGYLVHASKIRRAGVPIRTGYTIEKAYGTDALEGVVIVQVDSQFQPVPGTEETIPCDTLCLAVGLAPLTELCWQAGCDMAFIRELSGHIPLTDENLETSVPASMQPAMFPESKKPLPLWWKAVSPDVTGSTTTPRTARAPPNTPSSSTEMLFTTSAAFPLGPRAAARAAVSE